MEREAHRGRARDVGGAAGTHADPASLDDARDVAITVFLREARSIAAATGVGWPAEPATAVRGYLATEGLTLGCNDG